MRSQRNSISEISLKNKELHLDTIIHQCTLAKKEIVGNASLISKQVKSQRSGWKGVESILKEKLSYKNSKIFPVSKEIHEKFRKICESQSIKKNQKFSKFLVYNEKEPITDQDLHSQDAFKFFAANKREFGFPLKKISMETKRFTRKRLSCDFDISPEETVLQDIYAIKAKHLSSERKIKLPKVSPQSSKRNNENMKEKQEELNPRNKIVLAELKKLEPISQERIALKRQSQLMQAISKLEHLYK